MILPLPRPPPHRGNVIPVTTAVTTTATTTTTAAWCWLGDDAGRPQPGDDDDGGPARLRSLRPAHGQWSAPVHCGTSCGHCANLSAQWGVPGREGPGT